MLGLTVQNIPLDRVLAPIVGMLDQCWWYLGETGMSFPSIRPPARIPSQREPGRRGPGRHSHLPPARFDPADWHRFIDETKVAQAEYENWVVQLGHERFGKPGFFSRYAAGMDKNWKMFFASDVPTLNKAGSRRPPAYMTASGSMRGRRSCRRTSASSHATSMPLTWTYSFATSGCTARSWIMPPPTASRRRRSATRSPRPVQATRGNEAEGSARTGARKPRRLPVSNYALPSADEKNGCAAPATGSGDGTHAGIGSDWAFRNAAIPPKPSSRRVRSANRSRRSF